MARIEQWISEATQGDSLRQIASTAGLSAATLSRQTTNHSVTVETVVKIARAYQVSVIPALIALDVVTEDDIRRFAAEAAVQDADDDVLADEVLRRMKAGSAMMNAPISDVEKQLTHPGAVASLDDRRSNTVEDDVPPLGYVADSSPDEPEMGDDDYHDGP